MREIYRILSRIENESPENLILNISDKIRSEDVQMLKLNSSIPDSSIYCGTGYHIYDIPVDTEFDVIFSRKNPKEFLPIKAILKYVNVNSENEIDSLPKGSSGVCLIDFPNGKPSLLDLLASFNEERDQEKHDILYFTKMEVMNKILELLD